MGLARAGRGEGVRVGRASAISPIADIGPDGILRGDEASRTPLARIVDATSCHRQCGAARRSCRRADAGLLQIQCLLTRRRRANVGFEGGAEGMAVTVEGRAGAYRIGESEIFATPRLGRLVSDRDGTRVYRLRARAREYAIRGTTRFSDGEDRTVIRLEGAALTGTTRDAQIYRRFTIIDPSALHCPRTFTYSWDAMLGLPDS